MINKLLLILATICFWVGHIYLILIITFFLDYQVLFWLLRLFLFLSAGPDHLFISVNLMRIWFSLSNKLIWQMFKWTKATSLSKIRHKIHIMELMTTQKINMEIKTKDKMEWDIDSSYEKFIFRLIFGN